MLLAAAAFLLQWSTLPLGLDWYAVAGQVSEQHFDYLRWEVEAVTAKAAQALWGAHPYLDEVTRSAIVKSYMADLSAVQALEARIDAVYADPDVADPAAETLALVTERDDRRADLRGRQSLAEAILEGQVAAVLIEEGFGTAGQLLPPISMRFSEVPNLLVVSPRDQIRFDVSIALTPLATGDKAALEARVDATRDFSSLVVPLGGIALYPAMILETSNLAWAVETFAHEWLHHYLFFFPLGLQYDFDNEARIINETVADVFGKEIGRKVLERYYPQDTARAVPVVDAAQADEEEPAPFDFGAAMHETRVTVDALLTGGRVDEAEAYMRERQAYFYENGYFFRKLNQAFFAFYGGYQAGPVEGVGGGDPIGDAVRAVRAASPSAHAFVIEVRGLTTREALLDLRDRLTLR
jgi:hypothetical protein